MPELVDLTDDQVAEHQLAWVYDYGGRFLRYGGRYDLVGALEEDLEHMLLDDDVTKDEVVLWLHEIADMFDEEDAEQQQWQRQHPLRPAVGRLGWHLYMWAGWAGKGAIQ